MEKNLLQLGDAGIELALLVFGLVILAVFGQVAEAAGLFNQFRNFIRAGRFAVVELFFSSSYRAWLILNSFTMLLHPFL